MKTLKIATHDGVFHADEVFALTVLKLYYDQEGKMIEIIRTRNLEEISQCDIRVDVGGEYNHQIQAYDHHQKDKPGNHLNQLPYASFGLIWKHFGRKITSNRKVHEIIEKKLVSPIDALDNGVNITTPLNTGIYEYNISHVFSSLSAAFGDEQTDLAFKYALDLAEQILKGELIKAENKIKGEKIITKEIIRQGKPEILVLEKFQIWEAAVSKSKTVKLVVFPDKKPDRWCIQTCRDNLEIFGNDRTTFPHSWRGLTDANLALVTEIPDSVFCHTGGFFAVAKTKEAAIQMAQKAINHSQAI